MSNYPYTAARELLKIARGLVAYRLGEEGWLLPDGKYLEVTAFQGHTRLIIDWMIQKYAKDKEAAKLLFEASHVDPKAWKRAGLPPADMHYFMENSYEPIRYAFDHGWIRLAEDGVELPNQDAFRDARDFLVKHRSQIPEDAFIYVEVFLRTPGRLTKFEDLISASSYSELPRAGER